MTAKEYIQELGIEDETLYDNAERMHSLECLLEDYHQSQLKLLGLHGVVFSEERAEVCLKRKIYKNCDIWNDDGKCIMACMHHEQT